MTEIAKWNEFNERYANPEKRKYENRLFENLRWTARDPADRQVWFNLGVLKFMRDGKTPFVLDREEEYWRRKLSRDAVGKAQGRMREADSENTTGSGPIWDASKKLVGFVGDVGNTLYDAAKVILPAAGKTAVGVGKTAVAITPPVLHAARVAAPAAGKAVLKVARAPRSKLGNLATRTLVRTVAPKVAIAGDVFRAAQDYEDLKSKTNPALAKFLTTTRALAPTVARYALPIALTPLIGPAAAIPASIAASAAADALLFDQNNLILPRSEDETEIPII